MKDYKAKKDWLWEQMTKAGITPKDATDLLRNMEKTIRDDAKEEKWHLDATGLIYSCFEMIERIVARADDQDQTPVSDALSTITANLKKAAKTYYPEQESVWRQALIRMEDAGEMYLKDRIRPAKDPRAEDLRIAAQALKQRLGEAVDLTVPDFYQNVREMPGLVEGIGAGLKANDDHFAEEKQAFIDTTKLMHSTFATDDPDKKELKKAIAQLQAKLSAAVDPEDDEAPGVLSLPGLLTEQVKGYLPMVKNNKKIRAAYDKKAAKRDKKVAKGKDVPEIPAPDLEDTDAIRDQMLGAIKKVTDRYESEIVALKEKDYEAEALDLLKFFEEHQLNAL